MLMAFPYIYSSEENNPMGQIQTWEDKHRIKYHFLLTAKDRNALRESLKEQNITLPQDNQLSENLFSIEYVCSQKTKKNLAPFLFNYLGIADRASLERLCFSLNEYSDFTLDQICSINECSELIKHKKLSTETQDHLWSTLAQRYLNLDRYDEAIISYTNIKDHYAAQWKIQNLWDRWQKRYPALSLDDLMLNLIRLSKTNIKATLIAIEAYIAHTDELFDDFYDNYLTEHGFAAAYALAEYHYKTLGSNSFFYLAHACFKHSLMKETQLCYASTRYQSINFQSFQKIMGDSRQCMIYGFNDCNYYGIASILGAYNYSYFPFYKIPYQYIGLNSTKNKCKKKLSSLILKNYELTLNNQAIIPLIFCVEFTEEKSSRQFAYDKNHTFLHSNSTTDAEIRHLCKLVNEMPKEIRDTAIKTIKFVKVNLSQKCFSFEEIPPPWVDEGFKQQWARRKANKDQPYTALWKQKMLSDIGMIRERFNFFNAKKENVAIDLNLPTLSNAKNNHT